MKGLKRAIAYSLKPHELDLCGPQCFDDSKNILKEYLLGENTQEKVIRDLLDEFHGSSGYYRLIARLNGIKDYFDERVIEAYWIGNRLLDKVKTEDLKEMILSDFVRPDLLTEEKALKIIKKIPNGVVPHHSFHVFFMGSITGRAKITNKVKDVCKASWGKVIDVDFEKNKLRVQVQKLFPKKKVELTVDWDRGILPKIRKGDYISYHWNRASEKLTQIQLKNLIKYTIKNFNKYDGGKKTQK